MAGKRRELGEHLNEAQRRIECVGKALPSSAWRSAARETPDDRRDNPQFGFYAGDFEDIVPGQFPGSGLAMLLEHSQGGTGLSSERDASARLSRCAPSQGRKNLTEQLTLNTLAMQESTKIMERVVRRLDGLAQ